MNGSFCITSMYHQLLTAIFGTPPPTTSHQCRFFSYYSQQLSVNTNQQPYSVYFLPLPSTAIHHYPPPSMPVHYHLKPSTTTHCRPCLLHNHPQWSITVHHQWSPDIFHRPLYVSIYRYLSLHTTTIHHFPSPIILLNTNCGCLQPPTVRNRIFSLAVLTSHIEFPTTQQYPYLFC